MTGPKGPWIWTNEGRYQFFDERVTAQADWSIEMIAHSLAMQPRFVGHCKDHYSIAEHCVLMVEWCQRNSIAWDDNHQLRAVLLHDAAEAVIGDISRPMRRALDLVERSHLKGSARLDLEHIEYGVRESIWHAHDASCDPATLQILDTSMLAAEWLQVFAHRPPEFDFGHPRLEPIELQFWPWKYARSRFIRCFEEIAGD